jgi:hypothetical protein
MAKEHQEKFEFVSRGTSVRYIEVKSRFSAEELDAFITAHRCDDVSVNQTFGVGQNEVDEALKAKCVRRLSIVMNSMSLARLDGSSLIESIYMSDVLEQPFDFSAVRSLRSLNLNWHPEGRSEGVKLCILSFRCIETAGQRAGDRS